MVKLALIPLLVRTATATILVLGVLALAAGLVGRGLSRGKMISFVAADGNYTIHLLDVDHLLRVKLEEIPVSSYLVSPDGQRIAFLDQDVTGDETGIYLMDRYGTHLHQIDHVGQYVPGSMTWSPDSAQLAYWDETAKALFLLDVRSGDKRQLTEDSTFIGQPIWSPDGKYMAAFVNILRNQTAQIFILSTDDGQVRLLTTLQDDSVSDMAWSADGASLQFISIRATFPPQNTQTYTVYSIDVDGKNLQFLSEGQADYGQVIRLHDGMVSFPVVDKTLILSGDISWSDDNQWIAYPADLHTPQIVSNGIIRSTVIVISRPDGSEERVFNPHFDSIVPPFFILR